MCTCLGQPKQTPRARALRTPIARSRILRVLEQIRKIVHSIPLSFDRRKL
jgi:hypothetical protein